MKFVEKVERRKKEVGNALIIGLDTNIERLPERFSKDAKGVYEFNKYIVKSTQDIACAYKINSAFYEMLGPDGMEVLLKTRKLIGDIPTIYDAKRGDIASTARAYAKAAFEFFDFDAITLSPYMGSDAIEPFLKYKDKYTFLVCLSSNPSAVDFEYHGNPPLYMKVAVLAAEYEEKCGLVVGATVPKALDEIHEISPKSFILVPGVGAQGGNLKDVMQSSAHERILVNISRGIIFSENPRETALAYAKNPAWQNH